jgi:hypothetical protein
MYPCPTDIHSPHTQDHYGSQQPGINREIIPKFTLRPGSGSPMGSANNIFAKPVISVGWTLWLAGSIAKYQDKKACIQSSLIRYQPKQCFRGIANLSNRQREFTAASLRKFHYIERLSCQCWLIAEDVGVHCFTGDGKGGRGCGRSFFLLYAAALLFV